MIETTGAGDAFNGGLVPARDEGMDPSAPVRVARPAAALPVTRPGAAPSIPLHTGTGAIPARGRSRGPLAASPGPG